MNQSGRSFFPIVAPAHVPALGADGFVDLFTDYKVHSSTLKGAEFVAPAAGSASVFTLAFGGTWAAGETVRVTITSNNASRAVWLKTYYYEVQTGDTATIIATYFKGAIAADGANAECPYSATIGGSTVTVTAKDKKTHALVKYTNKVTTSGTLTVSATSTTIRFGYPDNLTAVGVPAADITLASYDTVKILMEVPSQDHGLDTTGTELKEIFWFGTPGNGAGLETLINSL